MYDFPVGKYKKTFLNTVKDQRQDVIDAVELPDLAVAYHQHRHGMATLQLVLRHHLTARAARSRRSLGKPPHHSAGNREGDHGLVGVGRSRMEHRRPLRAKPGRERRILLIRPLHDDAVAEPHRRPHIEMGIGRVGPLHRIDRRLRQLAILLGKLIQRGILVELDIDLFLGHKFALTCLAQKYKEITTIATLYGDSACRSRCK